MSQLVVMTFDDADQATSALADLKKLERDGQIEFEDTAVVTRTADGKLDVHQATSGATKAGAVAGGFLGLLLGGVFAPVLAGALGAAAGAFVGSSTNSGVDKQFVDEVKEKLEPGTSALFLVVSRGRPGPALAALRPYKGEVLQTSLSPELEDQLREALK